MLSIIQSSDREQQPSVLVDCVCAELTARHLPSMALEDIPLDDSPVPVDPRPCPVVHAGQSTPLPRVQNEPLTDGLLSSQNLDVQSEAELRTRVIQLDSAVSSDVSCCSLFTGMCAQWAVWQRP
eukprot:s1332_g14.t1